MKQFVITRLPLLVFLVAYVIFSVVTFKSYGITWDEPRDYGRGDDFIEYSLGRSDIDISSQNRYQGYLLYNSSYMAFNSFVTKYLFQAEDFAYRHLINLLFASLLFIVLYEILLLASGSAMLSILGPLFLFVTPSFTGHIPGNPKDIPFAILFLCALYLIVVGSRIKNSSFRILLIGLVFGLAIAQRLLGVQLLVIYLLYSIYKTAVLHKKISVHDIFRAISDTSLVTVVALFLLLVTWPFLAANPLQHGKDILLASSHYPWTGTLLHFGVNYKASAIPWFYLPGGFAVQVPLYITLLLGGGFMIIKRILKYEIVQVLLVTIVLNIAIYLVIAPVVYDTIRHYLFMIPLFVIISVLSLYELVRALQTQVYRNRGSIQALFGATFIVAIMVSFGLTAAQFIKLHPYQYVYHNELVGYVQGASGQFETDYWLASYKEAAEWLQQYVTLSDPNKKVTVYVSGSPYSAIAYLNKERFTQVKSLEDADYLILTTRSRSPRATEDFEVVHNVGRGGAVFSEIYKRR